MFAVVHSALELGLQAKHLAFARATLREGAIALCDSLRKHLPPYLKFRQPEGGYFVWVECPAHWDGEALWTIARNNYKVQFQPGVKFSATKRMRNFIRLSVSFYDKEDLEEGARRLGDAAREYEQTVKESPSTSVVAGGSAPSLVRVAVHGASGKLGSLIVGLLSQANKEGLVYPLFFFISVPTNPPYPLPHATYFFDFELHTRGQFPEKEQSPHVMW